MRQLHDVELQRTASSSVRKCPECAGEHGGIRIRAEQATGHITDIDPDETARALVWLNESYLRDALGRAPTADPATVVDVIERIWIATLYSRPTRETASSSR